LENPVSEPSRLSGTVVTTSIKDLEVRFFVENPHDEIQGVHYRGAFYEQGVLEAFPRYFRPGGTFLDVGANVGNHTVFAEKFLLAGEVIPIEPNAGAIALLRTNVALNGLRRVNLQHLGLALSDRAATHDIAVTPNNLGRAILSPSGGGSISSIAGDDLFAERPIDFIKMDVEGMEMAALRGLARTIARNRPPIFVEVDVENRSAFQAWLNESRYQITGHTMQRPKNQNFVIEPIESASGPSVS
jgi:FkbM family methyltransferase